MLASYPGCHLLQDSTLLLFLFPTSLIHSGIRFRACYLGKASAWLQTHCCPLSVSVVEAGAAYASRLLLCLECPHTDRSNNTPTALDHQSTAGSSGNKVSRPVQGPKEAKARRWKKKKKNRARQIGQNWPARRKRKPWSLLRHLDTRYLVSILYHGLSSSTVLHSTAHASAAIASCSSLVLAAVLCLIIPCLCLTVLRNVAGPARLSQINQLIELSGASRERQRFLLGLV